jgi:threonine synthase
MGSQLTHLECPRCGLRYDCAELVNLCRCGSPLLARYDLDAVRRIVAPADIRVRPADLWRYRELLPVGASSSVVTFGEGWTPLWAAPRYGRNIGVPGLLVKDEGIMPTGSFKARGAAVGVSRAAELGVRQVALPTNGNAGAAWATYAARAGMTATVAIPAAAPLMTRQECLAAGAQVLVVDGLIGDAGAVIRDLVASSGGAIFDVSTLREPYRLEGKKTMGFEIVEQLDWHVPDVIVYPTGGGVGLIGMWKAFGELRELGWLNASTRFVAVQSTGCAPIVRAFAAGDRRAVPWENAETIAFGINVSAPLGDELILEVLYSTEGIAVAVEDEELLGDLREFGRLEGLLLCPEGAACLTALRRLREEGWVGEHERVVVLNTGSGLKYPSIMDPSSRRRRS